MKWGRWVLGGLCLSGMLQGAPATQTAARFLSFGSAAKPVAMAEAASAYVQDASCLEFNPANLAGAGSGLSLSYQRLLADANGAFLAGSAALPFGTLALGYKNIDYGGVEDATLNAQGKIETKQVRPKAQALSFGIGTGLGGSLAPRLGVAATWWGEDYGGGALSGVAASAGLQAQTPGLQRLKWALAYNRLGSSPDGSALPGEARMGVAWIADGYGLSADQSLPREGSPVTAVGGELKPIKLLALRMGYQWDSGDASRSWEQGMSLGFGTDLQELALDYAFVPAGSLGNTHRVTLSWQFGRSKD
jgi:hypothetical protein